MANNEVAEKKIHKKYNHFYAGEYLNRVAFPIGGIGAGMLCLEGTGALSHLSVMNKPDIFNEPTVFSAVCIRGEQNEALVLEGPVPEWKIFGQRGTGNGATGATYGLPRFQRAAFSDRFPFATVELEDDDFPIKAEVTGWNPFTPGDADNSSLPVGALEYTFRNISDKKIEGVFSLNSMNFMANGRRVWAHNLADQKVSAAEGGFVLEALPTQEQPKRRGSFAFFAKAENVYVNLQWFRGGWFDPLTIAWKEIEECRPVTKPEFTSGTASPGGSLFVEFSLEPGRSVTIPLLFAWYVPNSDVEAGGKGEFEASAYGSCDPESQGCPEQETYTPWYTGKFKNIKEVSDYWRDNYEKLREESVRFCNCFYDSNLPPEVLEAVAANLTILKSPTVLRQPDGRLWCFEGCEDDSGCCHGSCTHVWNYAQAICNLFPGLERTFRNTEFHESQDERGHQVFRSAMPIRPLKHDFHAAADGQLGGIMKVHREWRIGGDTTWLACMWPQVRRSLDYCIQTWDPRHRGVLEEPHHNTYDIEFWGPDGMCTSFYLGALKAAMLMGQAQSDDVSRYQSLYEKGKYYMENELFNGEYFIQKIMVKGLDASNPVEGSGRSYSDYSEEAKALLKKEGPKYQYGAGCLSDGVLGAWMAEVCLVGEILDPKKVSSHLLSIHKYNFKKDLSRHVNPQRPSYALGNEGGLLLCSWPKGGKLSLPFVYSNEVWTGIEYQVASHLIMQGYVDEGLDIVRAVRDRYDGRVRNPFNEYECGHWYARAMSSYALIQALTGIKYDKVSRTLYISPRITGDFRSFIATEDGYGTAGKKNGKPFVEVIKGNIDIKETRVV